MLHSKAVELGHDDTVAFADQTSELFEQWSRARVLAYSSHRLVPLRASLVMVQFDPQFLIRSTRESIEYAGEPLECFGRVEPIKLRVQGPMSHQQVRYVLQKLLHRVPVLIWHSVHEQLNVSLTSFTHCLTHALSSSADDINALQQEPEEINKSNFINELASTLLRTRGGPVVKFQRDANPEVKIPLLL